MQTWKIFRILTTNSCNYKCLYCHNEGQELKEKSKLLSFENFVKIIKEVQKTSVQEVRFSGGEPLINKDTIKMIEWINDNTDFELGLATNASLISEELAQRLTKTRVLLTLHLPGIGSSAYKKVTQSDWDKFSSALALLDKYNLSYSFNYVLYPKSFENLDAVLTFIQEKNKRIKLLPFIESSSLNSSETLLKDLNDKFDKESSEKTIYFDEGIIWWKLKKGGEIKLLNSPCYLKSIEKCKEYGEIRLLPDLKLQNCIFDNKTIDISDFKNIKEKIEESWLELSSCYLDKKNENISNKF